MITHAHHFIQLLDPKKFGIGLLLDEAAMFILVSRWLSLSCWREQVIGDFTNANPSKDLIDDDHKEVIGEY